MNILDVIKHRRSVRDFTDRKIPESAIDVLVEALQWAPSAGNLQSRKFYFVFNEDIRNKLAQTGFKQDFVSFIAFSPRENIKLVLTEFDSMMPHVRLQRSLCLYVLHYAFCVFIRNSCT